MSGDWVDAVLAPHSAPLLTCPLSKASNHPPAVPATRLGARRLDSGHAGRLLGVNRAFLNESPIALVRL